ncbi:MAG: DNA adenine methylase [Candidatus Bathyarchaeia archaeon]
MSLTELENNEITQIKADKLRVHPINKQIYITDEQRKAELKESIKEHGILEPLIVTPDGEHYTILSGARRFECAQELGYTELPCIVTFVKDETLAIIEHNRYRQKTPIEIYNEAQVLRKILEPEARQREYHKLEPSSNLMKAPSSIDVQRVVAEKLNVSTGYLSMLEQVMENRDQIPDTIKKLEYGRETVYSAYKELKSKKNSEVSIPNIYIGHYFAGKQRLVKDIIARMPAHQCYVEVFGGFCSVLLNKPPSEVEVYNDISKDVVNLLLCIKEYPFDLFSELSLLPYSRWLYEQLIGIVEDPFEPPNPRRAAQWYYINESTFSGFHSEKAWSGTWRHGLTRNQPLEIRRKAMQLFAVAQRLYRVTIENKDYHYILEHYDGDDTLFYLDPPYYHTDDALGISWTKEQHEELSRCLKNLGGKWILTYNDAPEILRLYNDYSIERVTVPKVAPNSKETDGMREYYDHLVIRN